eukprot:CAMPEP_0168748098 /NCGR_PEP_ID=MMETSP0724-20121128/16000_1 /TAXON_ID=265536 /ORGANISM="Amphiprora sp., Strain CCMP467" /LENGTH=330 /DNA_ID=CAMNT_0008795915 /DNA_START=25 /DNA_END=1017 /DNA_ORIENTATION=-
MGSATMEIEEEGRLYRVTLLPCKDGTHAHITLAGRRRTTRNYDGSLRGAKGSHRQTADQACAILADLADDVTQLTLPMLQGYDWIVFCEAVQSNLQRLKEVSIVLGRGDEFYEEEESIDNGREADKLEFLLSRLPPKWNSLALKSLWRRQNAQDFLLMEMLPNFSQLKQLALFMFRREFSMEDSIRLAKALGRIKSIETLSMSGFKFIYQEAWNIVEKIAFLGNHKLCHLERLELCRCADSTILKIIVSDELIFALLYRRAKRVYREECNKQIMTHRGSSNGDGEIHRLALIATLSQVRQRTDCQFCLIRFCIDPSLWAMNNMRLASTKS